MERISFLDIFLDSWRLTLSRRRLFVFGLCIALPGASLLVFLQNETVLTQEFLETFVAQHLFVSLSFLLWYFFFVLFGKSNLIIALNETVHENDPKKPFALSGYLLALKKAFLLDMTIIGFFLLLIAILSLPAILSSVLLGTIPPSLILLEKLVLFPIIIIGYFVREFAYFYSLLSPLRLKSSFEAASNLFVQHRLRCLFFGLFFLCIRILFTFFMNLAMLGIVALLQKLLPGTHGAISFFVTSLILLTWYEVFRQALWFTFFRFLATPKEKATNETVVTPIEEKVTGVPTA